MSTENTSNNSRRDHRRIAPKASLQRRRVAKHDACPQQEEASEKSAVSPAPKVQPEETRSFHQPMLSVIGATLFGASLDAKLAQGQAPETSQLLATRAQLIASPQGRRKLASYWLDLLDSACRPSGKRSTGLPINRARIISATSQIESLVAALLAPLATSCGVAMAKLLLCDGSGPIFNVASTYDLGSSLRQVIARLDPLAAWDR